MIARIVWRVLTRMVWDIVKTAGAFGLLAVAVSGFFGPFFLLADEPDPFFRTYFIVCSSIFYGCAVLYWLLATIERETKDLSALAREFKENEEASRQAYEMRQADEQQKES